MQPIRSIKSIVLRVYSNILKYSRIRLNMAEIDSLCRQRWVHFHSDRRQTDKERRQSGESRAVTEPMSDSLGVKMRRKGTGLGRGG